MKSEPKKRLAIEPQPGPQTQYFQCDADIIIYGGSAGGGKALQVGKTQVLTLNGWMDIGEVRTGDYVYGMDGKPTLVTKAHDPYMPKRLYDVTFDNGEVITADSDHLWATLSRNEFEVRTTQEIRKTLHHGHLTPPCISNTGDHLPPRKIIGVYRVEPALVRCLTVAAPDGLYLVGKELIPTHNTWSLLVDPLRYIHIAGFGGIIFRRNFAQVTKQGGLWDASMDIYPKDGAKPYGGKLWRWPNGNKIEFAHLQFEETKLDYQGSEIPFIGFDELQHFCLTPDHEVLTQKGWTPISEVTTDDKAYAKMPDGSGEFRPVTATHHYDIDETIVEAYQRNGVSFRATKNHRVLIQRQDEPKSLGFVRADHLLETVQRIPRRAELRRSDYGSYVTLPMPKGRGVGTNVNAAEGPIPLDQYLSFMGWYLSEGCAYMNKGVSPRVIIRQTEPNAGLKELMDSLPWRVRPDGDGGYNIFSRQLYEHLKPLGNLYEKRVPRWIIEKCSPRELRIFYDAFVEGDGHARNGAVNIGLANEGLIDDLQEIVTIMGLVGTKGRTVNKDGFVIHYLSISQETRTSTAIKPERCKEEQYAGPVYCISVDCPELQDFTRGGYDRPNVSGGNFLIRHRGRVSFTGNSENVFWYLMSRSRSTCGIAPYVRCTCQADSQSWVASLISWYWDPDTGYPIKERAGVIRYFIRKDSEIIWGDTKDDLYLKEGDWIREREQEQIEGGADPLNVKVIKSFTFIPASVFDNKVLIRKDPGYIANLHAQLPIDKERLLYGNWKISPAAGDLFDRAWFEILEESPLGGTAVRFWDLAATASDMRDKGDGPSYTASVLLRKVKGLYYIEDAFQCRKGAAEVNEIVKRTTQQDAEWAAKAKCNYKVRWEQEPGSASKRETARMKSELVHYDANGIRPQGDKYQRAVPVAVASKNGLVKVMEGDWNDMLLTHLHNQPDNPHNDLMDALSGAWVSVNKSGIFSIIKL